MSKGFTAVAVLLAAQEGLVDLDTPISEYLPDYHINSIFDEHPEQKITLRYLLSHTAGFSHEAPVGNNYYLDPGTFAQHAASISDTWLRFPVGEHCAYSNLGVDIAGYIVQVRSGMPFQAFVKEKLLDPLGMPNTTLDIDAIRANTQRAIGHVGTYGVPPLVAMMPEGGVYTSANDMARYLQFEIGMGMAGDQRLLDEALVDEMDTQQPYGFSANGYGLGIAVANSGGLTEGIAGGGGFGFLSAMRWYPQLGLGIAWMSNNSDNDLQDWLADQMLQDIISLHQDIYRQRYSHSHTINVWYPSWSTRAQYLADAALAARIQDLALPVDAAARQRWSAYAGSYGIRTWGKLSEFYTLHVSGDALHINDLPLSEVQPGLFFSPDGERLDMRGAVPTWRNIRMERIDGTLLVRRVLVAVCALVFLASLFWILGGYVTRAIKRRRGMASSASYSGWIVQATRGIKVLASAMGLVAVAAQAAQPVLLFNRLMPTPGQPLWMQALLSLPWLVLALAVIAAVALAVSWRWDRGSTRERVASAIVVAVLFGFALVVAF
jgi:CubicO group peptidase (beta-lactamase class C family)